MAESYPVFGRPALARRRVVPVATRGNAVLLCDGSHVGSHVWPTGEEVLPDEPDSADLSDRTEPEDSAGEVASAEARAEPEGVSVREHRAEPSVHREEPPRERADTGSAAAQQAEPDVVSNALAVIPDAVTSALIPFEPSRPLGQAGSPESPRRLGQEQPGPSAAAQGGPKVTVEINVQTTLRFTVELPPDAALDLVNEALEGSEGHETTGQIGDDNQAEGGETTR